MISGSGTSRIESSAIWRLLHHNTRSILLTDPVRCCTQATSSQAAAPGQVEHALTRRTASGGTTVLSRCFISATHLPGRVEPLGICGTRAGEKMFATTFGASPWWTAARTIRCHLLTSLDTPASVTLPRQRLESLGREMSRRRASLSSRVKRSCRAEQGRLRCCGCGFASLKKTQQT